MAMSLSLMAEAQLVDDFSGSLSAYTLSRVLDNDTTANVSFSNSTGALQANATATSQAEQVLFLRNDYSLAVGQMLSATINWSLAGSQDLGICVASTATPTTVPNGSTGNTRTSLSYCFIGIRSSADHVVASGFDGATGLSTLQYQPGGANTTADVFIARTSATTFTLGYNPNGTGDVTLGTYTFANSANVGNAIGFYSDMRSAGSIGTFDNLTISPIPEPSTLALCGAGCMGMLGFFRRKK